MRLTILITTSPVPNNPNPSLLLKIYERFKTMADLMGCRIIILADGYKQSSKNSYKSGMIDDIRVRNYIDYLDLLNMFIRDGVLPNTELVIRDKRYGFASNIRYGLDLVDTKYVLIYQHDWTFDRPVNINELLNAMDRFPELRYIGFPSRENYLLKLAAYPVFFKDLAKYDINKFGVPLLPLNFWYDKPHIARVDFYKSFVYGQRHIDPLNGKSISVKNFIEDTLGQVERNDLAMHGMTAHAKYGTYLLYDIPGSTVVSHDDARHKREDHTF